MYKHTHMYISIPAIRMQVCCIEKQQILHTRLLRTFIYTHVNIYIYTYMYDYTHKYVHVPAIRMRVCCSEKQHILHT